MNRPPLDLDAARRLVEDMAGHLARLPQDSTHATLRTEVEELRQLLARADAADPEMHDRMRSVHASMDGRADELRAEGVQVGMFLRDIGRMLGLD